ncbi:aminotransferase class I/II-fold pyridoxal phosphate-dependent enzyme [Roseibium sp. Sym1]|uniref:aminotransferase class I/II-fold pyridoxal phosphate-dependent enzyme n=1 Tax=Roseibium sp. Sym1 TaxID=3016006 RepID=UPI002FBEA39F
MSDLPAAVSPGNTSYGDENPSQEPQSEGRPQARKTAPTGFRIPRYYQILKHNIGGTGSLGAGDLFYQNFEGLNNRLARLNGREFINFCSYNYLDLCGDPRVATAAQAAIEKYGTSVSASRIVSGERPIHLELEAAIADFVGTEAAIVFVGGFSTNEDTIAHLMGEGDVIFHDEYIHKSAQLGAAMSGAKAVSFPHNDLDALEKSLQTHREQGKNALVVVEGVYSMDGDIPDLPKLIELKRRYQTLLMVDEAHSIGVLGKTGRGLAEHFDIDPDEVDIWMGTLSKSFASCGGYIAGNAELIEYLRYTAPGFVYSVGLAPPMAAAALKALQLTQEEPQRVSQLHSRVLLFHTLAREAGINIGEANEASAVLPVIIGQSDVTIALSRTLMDKGILALPIGYPAVSKSKSRIRFFISCSHTDDDIRSAVEVISNEISGSQ